MSATRAKPSSEPSKVVYSALLVVGIVLTVVGPLIALWAFPLALTTVICKPLFALYYVIGIDATLLGIFLIIAMLWEILRRRG